LGRFINKAIEENTDICLITNPPTKADISFFDTLDSLGMIILYHEKLHANLWYFEIDYEKTSRYLIEEGYANSAIIGSACLTLEGLALASDPAEHLVELCYRLPIEKTSEAADYSSYILGNCIDHSQLKKQYQWQ
jgi:hypothetical protein